MAPIVNPYLKRRSIVPAVNQTDGVSPSSKKARVDNDAVALGSLQANIITPDRISTGTGTGTGIIDSKATPPMYRNTGLGLGRLRTREGITFRWIHFHSNTDSPSYNETMGRVYFRGFKLKGEEFYVNDVVKLKTGLLHAQDVRIIAVFQATKSFMGNAYGDNNYLEIQKRGHPYMEVQRLNTKTPEKLADWLLDASLCITKLHQEFLVRVPVAVPAKEWNKTLDAEQVHYYCKTKPRSRMQCILSTDDSDSSDDDDDHYDDDDVDDDCTVSVVKLTQNESDDGSIHPVASFTEVATRAIMPVCAPEPRIVIHQAFPFFDQAAARYTCSNDHLVEEIRRRNWTDIERSVKRKLAEDDVSSQNIKIVLVDENSSGTGIDESQKFYIREILAEQLKQHYGDVKLRTSQHRLCYELLKGRHAEFDPASERRYDVFYSAPCGFGKSLCFVAAATMLKGITLVVEPLRALIFSQMKELEERGVNVARLLPRDDVTTKGQFYAPDYLSHIVQDYNIGQAKPLIIFSTPELLEKCEICKSTIKELAVNRRLSLIVFDEFDYIDECHQQYRSAYTTIVKTMKNAVGVSHVPFLYLSATGSSSFVYDILSAKSISEYASPSPPILVQTAHILPQNHVYRVERKTNMKQSLQRIASILQSYGRGIGDHSFLRCVCFCLTPKLCNEAVQELNSMGIPAAAFYAETTDRESVLAGFHDGTISVICATSALGRGVHFEVPIRFIFHLVVPASLSEYIQSTGRGGRDGKGCCCTIFFRSEDFTQVKKVIQFESLPDDEKKRRDVAISNVFKYAMEGQRCRKQMLNDEIISFLGERGVPTSEKITKCVMDSECDNCCCMRTRNQKSDISNFVKLLLSSLNEHVECDWERYKSLGKNVVDEAPFFLRRKNCTFLNFDIQVDLHRYMEINKVHRLLLVQNKLSIYHLSDGWPDGLLDGLPIYRRPWYDFESIDHFKGNVRSHCKATAEYPFLLCFESARLGLDLEEIFGIEPPTEISTACEQLFSKMNVKNPVYLSTLRKAESNNLPLSTVLIYRANLKVDGRLDLLEPLRADDKRIFRMYGADRFLEISISKNVTNNTIKDFFSKDVVVANRRFKFFWFKKENGIHPILFAVSGQGIKEIDVESARDRCIPTKMNPDMSLGKWIKRMKLSFSTTTATCVLPPKSVSLLQDFEKVGIAEIDGAGLISSEALKAVCDAYTKEKDKKCGSGFQGRLAGFKGVWILDPSLQGFNIQCRKSQLKYDVQMKCREDNEGQMPQLQGDNTHETMEVNSFCNKQATTLNTRVVQMLEYYAALANKQGDFEELMMGCVKETTDEIEEIFDGSDEDLFHSLKVKMNVDDNDSFDSETLKRMSAASVDVNDPTRTRICKRWLENHYTSRRDKAHYPIKDCIDLRMYPDHTLLLEESEAFVVIDGNELPQEVEKIVAMRSPSYFAGDMRMLNIISKQTLLKRASQMGLQIDFFNGLRHAFVTSVKGTQAEAQRMSGGDYDGDRAWITWNSTLINCLPNMDKFIVEDTSNISTDVGNDSLENKLFSECSNHEILQYMIHFRKHHGKLSQLSEMLDCYIDKFGFEDTRTNIIGRAAFLQVDMPFDNPCATEVLETQKLRVDRWPHWKGKSMSYKSTKILGKMYTRLTETLEFLLKKGNKLNELSVPEKIKSLLVDYDDEFSKEEIAEQIKDFIKERARIKFSIEDDEITAAYHFEWQSKYLSKKRKTFCYDKKNPGKVALVDAAIIYEQCLTLENTDSSSDACDFAWGVCREELLEIFSGKNRISVSCDAKCFALR